MLEDDIEVLMARLPLRMRLLVLARTWEAIERMMAPQKLDEKTQEHIERARAARKAAGRKDSDF